MAAMRDTDEFDDPQVEGVRASVMGALEGGGAPKSRRWLLTVGPVALVVALAAGVVWYSYPKEAEKQELKTVPIVTADATPWRVAPEDPQGMQIPWRDSTVFEAMRQARVEDEAHEVENLLPAAEEPLERTALFPNTASPGLEDPVPASPSPLESVAPVVAMAEPVVAPTPQPESEPVAETVAQTEPAAGAAAVAAAEPAKGDFYIQIGSVRDRAAAASSWTALQTAQKDLLGDVRSNIVEANLGERGVFYRIQGGPLSEEKARSLCHALEARNAGGCLVIRP